MLSFSLKNWNEHQLNRTLFDVPTSPILESDFSNFPALKEFVSELVGLVVTEFDFFIFQRTTGIKRIGEGTSALYV